MRLGELQVDDKRKSQLVYSIGQLLKEKSTPYYPFSTVTSSQEVEENAHNYVPVKEDIHDSCLEEEAPI